MRKFILFCLFFNVIFGFKSQSSFNKAYHSASQIAAPFALSINGSYYHIVIVKQASSEANQAFLYKHKNDSVLKFRKPIIPNVKLDINQAFVTKDKGLMVLCNDKLCGFNSFQGTNSYLVKLDTNGNQKFVTTVNRQFSIIPTSGDVGISILDRFKHGFQNNDSTYTIITDSVIFKFSSQGLFLSKKRISTDSITAALLLQNGNILINGHTGNSHALMVISQTGSVLSTNQFPSTLKKILYYNGNKMLGLSANGNLYKITPNFSLIANTTYASNTKVTDFLCVTDTIYTCRLGLNSTSAYYVCDTSFNTIYNGAILSKSLSPVAITKSNQKIIIVANHTSDKLNALDPNYFTSLNVFDKNSTPIHNLDIELSKLKVDTAYYAVTFNNGYYTNFDLQLRLKFYVKNKSSVNIKQFKLSCGTSYYSPNCGAGEFYQEQFDGLNLLPGDSMQLTTGLITRYATLDNGGYNILGIPQQHCVYLTVPNEEVDNNQSDNEMCVFENFNSLGIKQVNYEGISVMMFPNPFDNQINIDSEIEIKTIQLKDVLGHCLIDLKVNADSFNFNTQELNKGIYFLSVETEKGIIAKKIIKN